MTKRILIADVKAALAKNPEFKLVRARWVHRNMNSVPCGGCLLTLMAFNAGVDISIGEYPSDEIQAWAHEVYGLNYTQGVMEGFDNAEAYLGARRDGFPEYNTGDNERYYHGLEDGFAACEFALAVAQTNAVWLEASVAGCLENPYQMV